MRPTSISKLCTLRAISAVFAISSVTRASGWSLKKRASSGARQVVADAERRSHSERPDVALVGEAILELTRLLLERLRARPERPPELAQLEALTHTVEELNLELALQVRERSADGGLRHSELVRCLAHALEAGHRQEHFELPEGETHRNLENYWDCLPKETFIIGKTE